MPRIESPSLRACPAPETVRAALLGHAPPDLLDFLSMHVPDCPTCAAVVEESQAAPPLLAALREAPLDAPPSAAELNDLASRLSGVTRPLPPLDELPEQVGPYRVKEQLGMGGMGVVYRAEDPALGRDIAIKMLRPGVDREPRYLEQFTREARSLAAVHHDHVVTVFQVGETTTDEGRTVPFLAMELLRGQTLQDWLRKNPSPPIEQVIRIGRHAAGGLAAAHARGLLHRDVKPANLWLEAPDDWAETSDKNLPAVARVKLIDFGLARAAGEGRPEGAAGTLGYMPPEQARGDALDARSDLFALGCVLYELCTGTRAFTAAGSFSQPLRVAEVAPYVPARLAKLVERLVSLDPADRPASAVVVERELALAEAEAASGSASLSRRVGLRRTALWSVGLVAIGGAAVVCIKLWPSPLPDPGPVTPEPVQQVAEPRQPFPAGPPDEEWCRTAAHRPPKEQFKLVAAKLVELNPGLTSQEVSGWIEPELVIRFTMKSNVVHDIRPVRGLPEMKFFGVMGVPTKGGALTDLSPLTGLPLKILTLHDQSQLRELSPVRECPLVHLDIRRTAVDSLADVPTEWLEELAISGSKVRDLSAIPRMSRLKRLECKDCQIESLEPLAETGLQALLADIRTRRDLSVLKRMPRLEKVNDLSLAEFYRSFTPVD
ncbi:MAG: protein kinase [Planctomycetes bacterium]|nr:protein kinase [Planctomycetota bacterium]